MGGIEIGLLLKVLFKIFGGARGGKDKTVGNRPDRLITGISKGIFDWA